MYTLNNKHNTITVNVDHFKYILQFFSSNWRQFYARMTGECSKLIYTTENRPKTFFHSSVIQVQAFVIFLDLK